ncbi:MAG: hypothetical protein KKF68_00130 [Nanoarchaeota archaeon]|nr:hypothetical protein [Nanoarchaeota archaeon]
MRTKNKKAQEEMIGFALIIIIVAVILLIFLGFSLRTHQKELVESYEVDSFIQSFLQYTSDCAEGHEPNYASIQKLIFLCNRKERCTDERDSCEVLNTTLTQILEKSWEIVDRPTKGYELNISSGNKDIILIKTGNFTRNYKGSQQNLIIGGNPSDIIFVAYY